MLAAVSRDEVDESRAFARSYGIDFPLITDATGSISKGLVGIDANDHSIPGVVVIRRGRGIVFRQVAKSKDDRLTAQQVLAAVDRSLGTSGVVAPITKPALERVQLRLETGAGQIRLDNRWRPTGVTMLTVTVPLSRYLLAGAGVASEYREARLWAHTMLGFRIPLWADIGALHVMAEAGLPGRAPGVYAGLRLGMWFAWTPRWAIEVDVSAGAHDAGAEDQLPSWKATFGVSRLLAF